MVLPADPRAINADHLEAVTDQSATDQVAAPTRQHSRFLRQGEVEDFLLPSDLSTRGRPEPAV